MAEAAAFGAGLQVLFGKVLDALCRYTGDKYRLLGGENQDLEKLKITLERFQEMLKKDGEKVFRNEETRKWYHKVRCAVNDADGILEDAEGTLESDSDSDDDHKPRVCHPFPTFFKFDGVWNHGKLGERITFVLQKLNGLEVEKSKLSFEEIDLTLNRETVSVSSKKVFGRNGEKEKIIDVLLNDANTQNSDPHIYAIIGMGGIGKTTLAQLIYNDTRMVANFEHRIWVWVSQNFDVKLVMEKIIESHSKNTRKFESLEATQSCLQELLTEKKFLLVLDDIWNENQDEWNKLKSSLNFGAPGSSILLTTRGSDVASTARAQVQHTIKVLSEEHCWQVFKESAFLEEKEENGQLEVIGKQIAKKCGGLPLAAKSLGGSLRLTRWVGEWESIRDSYIWELPQPCEILPALKLSLDSLKSYSRDCFTFCCVFPKGHQMNKKQLIRLWMANDLIPSHQRLGLEDVGNKIFNDLVLKSFFQVSFRNENKVTMHDLMHDLGLSFRTECFCLQGPDVSEIPTQCQHLFIEPPYPSTANILQTLSKSHSSLRTLLIPFSLYSYGKKIIFKNLDCSSFFSNLQCLRALDLSGTEIENLPKSIGKIKDLKYLNLSKQRHLTHLPNSIGALTKLQTLKLRDCESLTRLPDGITQLVSLRHLDLKECGQLTHLPAEFAGLVSLRHLDLQWCRELTHLPAEITRLVNLRHLDLRFCPFLTYLADEITGLVNLRHLKLQSCKGFTHLPDGIGRLINLVHLQKLELAAFVVGPDNGQRITGLQGLNCLEGRLTLWDLEHVRDAREAEAAFLNNKKNLSSLSLSWGDLHGSNSNSDKVEDVLEALQPPQSLNYLWIKGYGGSVFASWMKLLENLVEIELRDCIKCEHLPALGQLPLLERLTIAGMNSLKCINTEFYGSNGSSSNNRGTTIFSSLKELSFEDMQNLEEWKDIERDSQQTDPCPCLEWLTLKKCPKLKSLPSEILSVVQGLKIKNSDKVIVRSLSGLTRLELNGEGTNSVTSFPATSLQDDLTIKCYDELTFLPDESLSNLISLKKLEILSCRALQSLSQSLQYLSTLAYLYICDCDQLELSSQDFQNLISLRELKLAGLPKLMSIPDLQHLSTLQHLTVRSCKSLTSLWPHAMQIPTVHLEVLTLEDCEQLKLSGADFQHLIKLGWIHLSRLPELTSLPELQHLTVLEELSLKYCEHLKFSSTDFQHLINLRTIILDGLPKLISIPDLQHLSTLQDLTVRSCKRLTSLWPHAMQIPTVLEKLTLEDCEQLKLSGADFQHLTKLQRIRLSRLPELRSLPELQHLQSLYSLYIYDFKKLKELPQWLQNLTSLQTLEIEGCDHDLESRCAQDSGEYWPFIKHIPHVSIISGNCVGFRL